VIDSQFCESLIRRHSQLQKCKSNMWQRFGLHKIAILALILTTILIYANFNPQVKDGVLISVATTLTTPSPSQSSLPCAVKAARLAQAWGIEGAKSFCQPFTLPQRDTLEIPQFKYYEVNRESSMCFDCFLPSTFSHHLTLSGDEGSGLRLRCGRLRHLSRGHSTVRRPGEDTTAHARQLHVCADQAVLVLAVGTPGQDKQHTTRAHHSQTAACGQSG
jgi:hypothetical protein